MKAAVVTGKCEVAIKEMPEPEIRDDEVLIKVRTAGVCGSDLHLFRGTHAFRKPPAVLGHEVAGDVVKIGKNVTRVKVGDRVTVEPHIGCGKCEFCRQDLTNICDNKSAPGTPSWIGTFVEYFNAPEKTVYKLADTVSYEEGTMIEPLAVAVHALSRAKVTSRECIAIFGTGTIGLMCLVVARELGYKKIIATDIAPFNRKMAMQMGAYATINPLEQDVAEAIMQATAKRGADLVLVCAGADDILTQASQSTRKRGEIGIIAMITKKIPFYCYDMVFKEQSMYGAMTYETRDFVKAWEMINNGLDMKPFITQRLPLDKTQEALDILSDKKEDVVKVIVTVS